ncbi:MAG: hypothetical protein RL143_1408 [Pseudomonadota bacterium]
MRKLLFTLLVTVSTVVWASQGPISVVNPGPLAKLDKELQQQTNDYRLALGAAVKINRTIRLGNEMRLSGELSRVTWEYPKSHEPSEALESVREQLLSAGAELLFECEGRDCGASNIWANDLFQNPALYGRDDFQRYVALQLNGDFYAIYANRRGNQRVYLHIDQVKQGSDTTAWINLLSERGWVKLPDHQAGLDQTLAQRESEAMVKQLAEKLIAAGVSKDAIETYGIGALAPSVLGADRAVVVVIVQ